MEPRNTITFEEAITWLASAKAENDEALGMMWRRIETLKLPNERYFEIVDDMRDVLHRQVEVVAALFGTSYRAVRDHVEMAMEHLDAPRTTDADLDKPMDSGRKRLVIEPDMVADVTSLPFDDESFSLVIFDPPHLVGSHAGIMKEYYGSLASVPAAREFLRQGFSECWRVLKPGGTLVFKWFEHKLPLKEILELAPCAPVCGNKRPGKDKTHWLVFFKALHE